jgi:hypothetical protein
MKKYSVAALVAAVVASSLVGLSAPSAISAHAAPMIAPLQAPSDIQKVWHCRNWSGGWGCGGLPGGHGRFWWSHRRHRS